jgi:hypothetical protein
MVLHSVAAPAAEGEKSGETAVAEKPKVVDLTEALATITSATKAYSSSKLPPTPTIAYKHWEPQLGPTAPHDPASHFPMRLFR